MMARQATASCLWFDGRAEEAAEFYVSVFPASRIDDVVKSPLDTPGAGTGSTLLVEFTLAGQRYLALNGGPHDTFNDALSLVAMCRDQSEVDRLWDALTADGGKPVQCGWLKDKFGVSWQVVPDAVMDMIKDRDRAKAKRVMEAMLGMTKIDIATLRSAYDGR